MTQPATATPPSGPIAQDAVTLVHGTSFCVSGADGEVEADAAEGMFFRDTRIVSEWHIRVDGRPVQPIAARTPEPYRATFLGRAQLVDQGVESNLLVQRERYVGRGMREDIMLRNFGLRECHCSVTVELDADFADLFEVKQCRVTIHGEHSAEVGSGELRLTRRLRDGSRGIRVTAEQAEYSLDRLTFRVSVPPKGEWATSVTVQPMVDGDVVSSMFPVERPVEQSVPAQRIRKWREEGPVLRRTGDPMLGHILQRSFYDLGALRIFDRQCPDDAAIAAGAPWFMAVFGRDSILSSMMAIPIDPMLALGTVETLARHQGVNVDPGSEEQPGRILHEMRFGADSSLALGGSNTYYGTVDATPLFVMLVGELCRWGIEPARVEALVPHVDRALAWIERYGDADGDSFVEYQRTSDRGLVNQGWKDSWDGVNFADGRIAEAPIALCEVQGYVYAAYRARADIAEAFGDTAGVRDWLDRAADFKKLFNERFWLPDLGRYALGFDRDKRPIDALASNLGHLLWTGIVEAGRAEHVAEALLSPQMFSGWGVRTLAANMGAYNPMSYHNGSVWPHDTSLCAAGLMRYGFVDKAQRLASALFAAAAEFDGRLPELMCGFSREEFPQPMPYPTSCSPQAWASASPMYLLRVLMRMEPRVARHKLWLAPALPESFSPLAVDDVPLANARLSIDLDGGLVRVRGMPPGIDLVREPLWEN